MTAKSKELMWSGTMHFSVCGEGITGIIRSMYCFEDNKEGAMNILSSFPGMTEEQKIKICTGDAHLTDMREDGTVGYVVKEDLSFKHEYHNFLLNKERRERKIKEAEEAARAELEEAAEKNHISPECQEWVNKQNPYHDIVAREEALRKLSPRGREMYDAGLAITMKDGTILQKDESDPEPSRLTSLMTLPEFLHDNMEKSLPTPSKETIRVGRWDVPKNYLDRYAGHVVKRIRGLIWMQCAGVVSLDAGSVMSTYNLEMERQMLHNAICDAIGVPHGEPGKEHTRDQIDFDEALGAYLDVHAGKLFNGDE